MRMHFIGEDKLRTCWVEWLWSWSTSLKLRTECSALDFGSLLLMWLSRLVILSLPPSELCLRPVLLKGTSTAEGYPSRHPSYFLIRSWRDFHKHVHRGYLSHKREANKDTWEISRKKKKLKKKRGKWKRSSTDGFEAEMRRNEKAKKIKVDDENRFRIDHNL